MKKNSYLYATTLMGTVLLFTIHSVGIAQSVSFASVTHSLSQEEISQLNQGIALAKISSRRDKERLIYTPQLPLFDIIKEFISDNKPNILYESLFLFRDTDFNTQTQYITQINNYLRDVSILANVEYQNLKDGNIHPLFKSSRRIVSSKDHSTIDNLIPLALLPTQNRKETIKVKQDMPPFGDIVSRYQYRYKDYYSEFLGNNETNISYNNIRAVKPNHMFTGAWLIRTNEGILLYGVGAVRISGLASLFNRVIENSFASRMVGLFKWLSESVLY